MKEFSQGHGGGYDVAAMSGLLDIMLQSSTPTDLCKGIAHSDFVYDSTRGVELLYLDSGSALKLVARYGKPVNDTPDLSAWSDSPISESVREKQLVVEHEPHPEGTVTTVAITLISTGVPVGVLALRAENSNTTKGFEPEVVDVLSRLGAYYLYSLDIGLLSKSTGSLAANPEDLTSRPLTILEHIEDGLVNLEISKILMLSESTIRQETVKIYKSLGVGNRQEAAKVARALGLLAKRSLTTPPPQKSELARNNV